MCFDGVLEKLGKVIDIITGATQSDDTIYGGGASHVTGLETRGGRLSLTPDALIFQSHGLNIQNKTLTVPLEQCANVATYRTLGLIPNGLRITMKDDREERFIVFGHKIWAEKIQKAMEESGGSRTLEKLMGQ